MAKKKASRGKSSPTKSAKARAARKSGVRKTKRRVPRIKGRPSEGVLVAYGTRGLGARSGGQSGDTQGLSASPGVDSESVEELMEEGQSFEAEVLNGIERVPDPDEGEVRTDEVAEDDVPEEYREIDR